MTGAVRLFDPDTSYKAAQVIGKGVENAVYSAYCCFDLTDDELCATRPDFYGPTLKSARSRLAKRGILIDSGLRRPSNRGRDQIVWAMR